MYLIRKIISLIVLSGFIINTIPAYPYIDKLHGLSLKITKIDNFPLSKHITKNYDLYELNIFNGSHNTYSIPGYSFDFGVQHHDLQELTASARGKLSKKVAVFNFVANVLFIPFGGIVRNASRSAVSSVGSFKKKGLKIYDTSNLLLVDEMYMFYPYESKILYFLVHKDSGPPKSIKFVCKNEELNINHVVINNDFAVENVVLKVTGKFRKHYESNTLPVKQQSSGVLLDAYYYDEEYLDDEEYLADPTVDGYQ